MKIVIADTETTGFGKDAKIVEYAHAVCHVEVEGLVSKLVIDSEYETLINPGIPIPFGASKVHGIYDHHVTDAIEIHEALPAAFPHSSRVDLLGHNFVRYDMQYLEHFVPQHFNVGCSLVAAKHYLPDQPSHSLDNLRKALGFPDVLAHSAMGDVHSTIALINHMLQFGQSWEEFLFVSMKRIDTMPFGKHKGKRLEDLPETYVKWLLTEATDINWEMRRALQEI